MAALTTAQEYAVIREAVQQLATGKAIASVTIGDVSTTFVSGQLEFLQRREIELARRLSVRNTRKRVTPDYAEGTGRDY